jgi:hypothetical protein
MGTEGRLTTHIQGIIDEIEKHIEARSLTQSLLRSVQNQLDSIERNYKTQPFYSAVYGRMLEAQTLIYGESGEEQKALEFMKEAVRQAGSVSGLYSKMLRDYIAEHLSARQAAGSQTHHAANMHAHKQAAAPVRAEVQEAEQPQPEAQQMQATAEPVERKARHAGKLHLRLKPSRKLRIVTATAFGLLVLCGIGFAVKTPSVSALTNMVGNHSKIAAAKHKYDQLSAEYKDCSNKLIAERSDVNTNNLQQLATYNQDVTNCQQILQQQHQAADAYNALVGVQ